MLCVGSREAVAEMTSPEAPAQLGRRRITTRAELEHVAFELFERQGYRGHDRG